LSRRRAASPLAVWAGLLTLYFVWGSTYIGIRLGVETIPPFLMAAVRFLIAGSVVLAWEAGQAWRLRGDPTVPEAERPYLPTRREWRDSAIVGGLLLFGGMGMVALGEKTVPAGIAAILVAMLPVWVAVLGRIFFGERLPVAAVVGIVVGLVGVIILVGPFGAAGRMAFDPFGIVCLLFSPLCWGSGSLYSSHRAVLPRRPLTATGVQMICGGILLLVGSILVGELATFDLAAVSSRSWLGLVYLTTIGSLVGFTTYVWLLRVAPLPKIATYAYVNPVVAFVLAGILLGETIEPRTVLAGAVIVFAVALIVTARSRAAGGAPEVGESSVDESAASGAARPIYPD
jgi:drug/metabolite transporter (DMT)-like permease